MLTSFVSSERSVAQAFSKTEKLKMGLKIASVKSLAYRELGVSNR